MKIFLISNSPFPQSLQILFDPSRKSYNPRCRCVRIQQAEAQQESAQKAAVHSLDNLQAGSHQRTK